MKKITIFIVLCLSMLTVCSQTIPQGINVGNNMSCKKLHDSTFLFTFKLLRTDNRPDTMLSDTSINWMYKLNNKINNLAFEIVGWNTAGDTIKKTIFPNIVSYTKKTYKGNPKLKQLVDYPHLNPATDSVVMTGMEITLSDSITLPHHGVWTFETLGISPHNSMTYANYCLRYRGVTNLSDVNFNPNMFNVPGPVPIVNTNTVVGMVSFNSLANNHTPSWESDSWIQAENGAQVDHSLGFNDQDNDSLVITRVNTMTSDIPMSPVLNANTYNYLYYSTKVVAFKAPYTFSNPFESGNTFWFQNQIIHFKVPLGVPQQAAVLTFKIDEYDHVTGVWKGTSYRDIFIVSNDPPPATPNGIAEINQNNVSVYPIPAQDFISITNYSGPVEIYNFAGQKFFNGRSFSKIDTSTWPNGLYLVKMANQTTKVVVSH